MMTTRLALWLALGTLGLAPAASAQETGSAGRLTGTALVEALRQGGHVIFIRHAQTEKDYADQVSAVMGDCSTQRALSAAGWRQAREMGAVIAALRLPVAQVISSEYCRSWQTADLAFGRHVARAELNFEPAETYTDDQLARMRERMTPLLAAPPPEGFNTVLVGHDDPFEAATGVYPEPQGAAYVLRPGADGGFTIVGYVAPDAWPELLAAGG